MPLLLHRANDALKVNPSNEDFKLVTHGSNWLWAVTAVYCLALLFVVGTTYIARQGEKIFHYLFTISLLTGSIAYFAMASNLGSTSVLTSIGDAGTREIFYARYINWFISFPPILLSLGLISGISWTTIIYNIFLVWIFIISYLMSALTPTVYKWGFYVFGTCSLFLLAASLLLTGRTTSRRLEISKTYLFLTSYLLLFYFLYPIAFGVDDGGNVISVTSGFIFVGILDLFTVPFFAVAVLVMARKLDYKVLNLYFTQYGRVAQGGEWKEKVREAKEEEAAASGAAPAGVSV
jgi:bacteriorhodopsin